MMCWDDAHCLQVPAYATNGTCLDHNACILPQTDSSRAHDVILFNLTKSECEVASLGVSL
jgi:hypothetical protein